MVLLFSYMCFAYFGLNMFSHMIIDTSDFADATTDNHYTWFRIYPKPVICFSNQQSNMVVLYILMGVVFCFCPQGTFQRSLPFSHMTQSTFWIPIISHQVTILLLYLPFLYLRDLMTPWWQTCWKSALEKEQSSVNMIPWPLGASKWEMRLSGPTKIIRPKWQPWSQVPSETRSVLFYTHRQHTRPVKALMCPLHPYSTVI